ncbi:MAG: AraC family transcriptional regulator [Ruminococcaceae bacterium]|nr:AraC family transcriptional regulator [Oscillospiraceae bacterium]
MQCTSIVSYNECITPSVWDFPNITRPFSIIYYALGGCAYFKIDGVERRFKTGHLYLLPANKVFSLREDPNDKFYSVYIHAIILPELRDFIELDVERDEFLRDILSMIRRYVYKKDTVYIRKLTETLISYISETETGENTPLHRQIKNRIDTDFVKVFRGGELSREFNYSSSYIAKQFKSEYGTTPKQYAKQLVLKEIADRLMAGHSVSEISELLGFSSPENMSRLFKASYGYSPTEYKKKFKNFPE